MITVDTTLSARYHLESLLGRGGMADVYRGRDLVLERPVAVKVVRGADDEDARRFAREVRTMASLSHPGIVQLFDAGTDEGVPYLVMELVEGSDLPAVLADGPLDPQRVRTFGRQLARALAHAHATGVVHRDVKPGNVLVDEAGRARLSDFGIARLADATRVTTPGMTSGTAAYLAPEQLSGEDVGPPADVYALGLVLLEALTGHREYNGTAVEAAMARLERDPVVPDGLGEPWTNLLRAMTARDPARRPSASAVAQQLSVDAPPASAPPDFAADPTIVMEGRSDPAPREAERDDPAPRRPAPPPRRRGPVLAGVVGLMILAAAVVAFSLGDSDVPDDAEPAQPGTGLPGEVDDALRQLEEAVRP